MSRFLFTVIWLLAISLLFSACRTASARPGNLPAGVKAARVNGYDVAYVERGRGTPIVMIHGSLLDYRAFHPQMEPLGAHYRAIALSLRHYYPERWDGRGAGFSHRQHAADVVAFVRMLGVGPVHLIGHSRGGVIALHVAKTSPDVVRTLVLAEPSAETILGPSDAGAGRRQQRVDTTLQMFERGDIEGGLQHFIDDVAGPGSWSKRTEPERQVFRDNAWTLRGDLPRAQDPWTCQDAQQLGVPVLLVGGALSPPVYGRIIDVLASCARRTERVTIPNASHGMNRMNPSAFNTAVLNFLAKH
jgi:esterase